MDIWAFGSLEDAYISFTGIATIRAQLASHLSNKPYTPLASLLVTSPHCPALTPPVTHTQPVTWKRTEGQRQSGVVNHAECALALPLLSCPFAPVGVQSLMETGVAQDGASEGATPAPTTELEDDNSLSYTGRHTHRGDKSVVLLPQHERLSVTSENTSALISSLPADSGWRSGACDLYLDTWY
ncbi:hypothetical protein PAMP_018372 [Pampus punctatissimus]